MKALITGFSGHIGSKLIRELDAELILLDDFSTGRYCSLFDLDKSYALIEDDICDLKDIPDCDVVIHLAALTNNKDSFLDPESYYRVNVEGLKNIARLCESKGIPLIFPSTTAMNGEANSPYLKSKKLAEEYLNQTKNLKYTILRFGGVFGYSIGMRFHTVVNKLVWQAIHGQPLTVWSNALEQVRPYLDLSDCVRIIKYIVDQNLFENKTYDCLTGNYTIQEILNAIPLEKNITFVDSPSMNESVYLLNSSTLEKRGFRFRGNLETAIKEIIHHVKTVYYSGETTATRQRFLDPR